MFFTLKIKMRQPFYKFAIWLLGKCMIDFDKQCGGRYLDDLRCITPMKINGTEYVFEGRFFNASRPIGGGETLSTLLWTRDSQYVATRGTREEKHQRRGSSSSRRYRSNSSRQAVHHCPPIPLQEIQGYQCKPDDQ